ncbi:MAG: hypothetical protein EOO25_06945 [Comamonadaceae bacterium]|nr:MAG: hypothetical protein EOO25_06945 [Comamonadaceae bacterium]
MNTNEPLHEYLVLSRGQWDDSLPPHEIQEAIDRFYQWHEACVGQGRMKPGQRLAVEGKRVSRGKIVDGPFAEAKEVIGGYWFVNAASLEEAAALMSENPCIACGLEFEVRPIEPARASAYVTANETPAGRVAAR